MAALQISRVRDARARCDVETGHCRCGGELIFDGAKCIERGEQWKDVGVTLVGKWSEIPFVQENYILGEMQRRGVDVKSLPEDDASQVRTTFLSTLPDSTLIHLWKRLAPDDTFSMYYASIFRGKRILDIGSGFGRQVIL